MKFLLILFLFVLGVEAQTKHHAVVKKRVITGGAPVAISDDFTTDPTTSRWTVEDGTVNYDAVSDNIDLTGSPTVWVHTTALTGDDGFAMVEIVNSELFGGIAFRYTAASSQHYVLRTNSTSEWVWRYCTGGSCTNIETDAHTVASPSFYLGVRWSGTGASTLVEGWVFNTPPTDRTDPTTWDGDGNLVDSFDFTADPGANARDTGDVVGLYVGSTTDITFDNFTAGD